MLLQLRTVILISSSLLVVTLLVRELTAEAHVVTVGRVRSIRPSPTTVSASTSTAVAFSLRTATTVATASAFVAFLNDFIIIEVYNKCIKITKPEGKMSSGYFISFHSVLEWEVIIIHIC